MMQVPAATYRLQFNQQFRFADAWRLVPYLNALGVSTLYASPLLKARQGSPHGYDITDPTRLSPQLGDEEEFFALTSELRQHGMGLLLDIVPNHMATSSENPWWEDVLQNGLDSPFATYFDIDWQSTRPGLHQKVLVPILGAPYGKVLENQELTLMLAEDGFWVCYHHWRLPLSPKSYLLILRYRLDALLEALGAEHPAVLQFMDLLNMLERLPGRMEDTFTFAFRQARKWLWYLYTICPEIQAFVDGNLRDINGRKGEPRSFDRFDQILMEQAYRLAFWRVARQEINYRRFFDVSELISICIEEEHVFAATHSLILQLVRAGQVTGFRIDHVDGLYDPQGYLWRLQSHLSCAGKGDFYILVEKILCGDEELPAGWPVSGTTGYDFLNTLNGLFVDERGAAILDEIYARMSESVADFATVVHGKKHQVMVELFASEVRNLVKQLGHLAQGDRYGRDLTLTELEKALIEITACLPVYRTYIRGLGVADRDRMYIEGAVLEAVQRCPAIAPACDFLRRVLLLEFPDYLSTEQRQAWLHFVMRWQQFSGPVMAKGFEDTALYVYNRLISLNEVGGDPRIRGVSVVDFHRFNQARQKRWPYTLNATSTHDNKRSEDVRARINVLSEIPAMWGERVEWWCCWNQPKKQLVKGQPVPDGNEELLIYQTLVGTWPLQEEEIPAFKERLRAYIVKAAREAKVHTNWLSPDSDYEEALKDFVTSILEPTDGNRFLHDFLQFQKMIAYYGALGSLAQILLKITSPGVPDFYQGTELWNFSLVDPDNRRPVDFQTRALLLAELQRQETSGQLVLAKRLLAGWEDGRIKLYLTYKALLFRKAQRELFASGEYLPVEAFGSQYEHVCAFARSLENTWALVAVPRLLARLLVKNQSPLASLPLGKGVWRETCLMLPEHAPDHWRNVLTGEVLTASPVNGTPLSEGRILPLARVFRNFPVALLQAC